MKKFYSLLISLLISVPLFTQNLIPNGDFEAWTGDVPNGYTLLQITGRSDLSFLRATSAGRSGDGLNIIGVANGSGADGSFEITVSGIIPGKTYELSCYVKSNDDKVWIRYWDTRFLDASDATVGSDLDDSNYNPLTSNTWTKYGPYNLVAPTNAAKLRINLRVYVQSGFVANTSSIIVDDLALTDVTPTADATLSDLKVDGTTINGFSSNTLNYVINLPANTSTVPTVTATATDAQGTVAITPATDLTGDKAARTTTIVVTGSDGTTKKTYTVQFDPLLEYTNIAALRAATELDRLHKLTGEAILTAQMSFRNKKFVQDATGAIQIDDNTGIITTAYNVGDGITGLKGTMGVVSGMLQFYPSEDPGAKTSQDNTVIPQVLTITDFKTNFENYESELIKLEDVSFEAGVVGGTFANGTNYPISRESESTIMRTEFYGVFTSTTIPATANITGIAIEFNGTAQIAPRIVEDIGQATAIYATEADGIILYPVPAGEILTIEGVDSYSSIEIRNVAGKMVHAISNNGEFVRTVEMSQLPAGIYFIRLTSPAGTITKKFIKN